MNTSNGKLKGLSLKLKRNRQDRAALIVFAVIFTLYSLVLLFPFYWILINSLKTKAEFAVNTWSFPTSWVFSNYSKLFQLQRYKFDVFEMFKNSLILCLIVPTMSSISTTLAAYVMAKYKFRGRNILFFIFMIPMIVSIAGTASSTLRLFEALGFDEMPFVGIAFMSASGTGLSFLLTHAIFKGTSDTYMEAARIDGAGHLRTFFQIMLSHAMGIIGTNWVLGFIGTWNDYITPRIFLGKGYMTIATGLEKIHTLVTDVGEYADLFMNNYPLYFAAIILSIIPIIILLLVFQKQIMKISLGGGIK